MKILAIDTATEACSVALQLDEHIVSRFEVCPQQHSQRLLPMVDDVLREAGVELSALDLLAFGRGPGSFTGVRIATGMIQGLALGSGLKVAGVSTLEAMAREVAQLAQNEDAKPHYIAVASDARMDEVYFAVYQLKDGEVTLQVEEQVCPPSTVLEQLMPLLASDDVKLVAAGTGWGAYQALSQWLADNTDQHTIDVTLPNATHMLALAKTAQQNGQVSDAVNVEPVYLRDKVTWKKLPGRE